MAIASQRITFPTHRSTGVGMLLALLAACAAEPNHPGASGEAAPAAVDEGVPADWRHVTSWAEPRHDHRVSLFRRNDGATVLEIGPRDAAMIAADGPAPEPIPILGVVVSLRGKVLDSFGPDSPGGVAHRTYRTMLGGVPPTVLRFDTYGDRGNGPEVVLTVAGDGSESPPPSGWRR